MVKKIIKVKILGDCSKHIGNKKPKKFTTGNIIPDKDLHCISCELKKITFK